jgi:hypothetical protein
MNAIDRNIASLREQVVAAQQEVDMAIAFHETWRPTAFDQDLHERMGTSFASRTFDVVRVALRREMLLALMRLWDNDQRNVQMERSIAPILRDQSVVDALAADQAAGMPGAKDRIKQDLSQCASEAIALVDKYRKDGSHYATLEKLRALRNERLAHRPKEWRRPGLIPPMRRSSPSTEIIWS